MPEWLRLGKMLANARYTRTAAKELASNIKNTKLITEPMKISPVVSGIGASTVTPINSYHLTTLKMPLSKPISTAELNGWPKQFRNQKRGQISASEYSGLPRGERNNGRYGDIRFIRHMDAVPELTEDGFVQIAPARNYFANFTTDQLMVPHEDYRVESIGKNALMINPEAFRGTTPLSLNPGDSFFLNSKLKIKPKHITFISGDPQSLQLAMERGFNVESSPKLKILSKFINPATGEEQLAMRPELEKRGYWSYGREFTKVKQDYINELTRVMQSRYNRPSLKDYQRLENVTHVPTNVYPNVKGGVPESAYFYGPKTGYKQVVYDTTPPIEHSITTSLRLWPHPTDIESHPRTNTLIKWNNWLPIKKQGGTLKYQRGGKSLIKVLHNLKEVPKEIKPVVQTYQIQHLPGYQLKSLMSGNPLEKQLSKTGTISTASIDALSKKMSAVEQAVIGKVLTEKFPGQKAIDYNDFRKGVQDELISYDRTPSTEYENYGIDRLGFKFADPGVLSIAGWDNLTPNTFTFSSPRIPIGNGRHYDINTLGHSRTFTIGSEPDVLHVMESQSDAAQAGRKAFDQFSTEYLNDPEEYQKFIDRHKNLLAEMEAHPEEYQDGAVEKQRQNIAEHERALKAMLTKINPIDEIQAQHLMDIYPIRQLQENLRYAAEKGQTKMRYPTRETAAKIEGYPERAAYYDASGKDITTTQTVYTRGEDIDKNLEWLLEQREGLRNRKYQSLLDAYNAGKSTVGPTENVLLNTLMVDPDWTEVNRSINDLKKVKPYLKPGITKKIVYDKQYESILKRYSDFPKQFGKLFKGAPVRTTQDLHGNTWYEVDVPKDYLQMEWPFKDGGSIPSIFKEGGILKAQKGKVIKVIGKAIKGTSKPALVKYYAPTMGKTFAAKSNPLLVDFDDIIRDPSRQILDTYGFKSKSDMYNSGNTDAISAYENMLVEKLNGLRTNPQYNGKTVIVSPTAVANPDKIGFRYDNVPSIPAKSIFIERNVGRGGTPGASEMWYNSLIRQYPGFNIENRFVSELEPMPTNEQWDALYNAAIESGNMEEVQRLRDIHFNVKASDNKLVNQNGGSHKVWHGSPEEWNIFDDNKRGLEDVIYFSTDKSYADQFTIPKKKWKLRMIPTKSSRPFYLYGKTPLNIGSDMESDLVQNELMRNWMNGGNADSVYGLDLWTPDMPLKRSNGMEFGVLRRNQMKLANPITFDDNGNIIPLSKRDDFSNSDIRYGIIPLIGLGLGTAATQKEKNGGKLKSVFNK